MASRKVQVTFELSTEKEWSDFIKQRGLIVVDLYRDWAGPCVAMMTPLKQLKTSEMAFEWMHLASAPSSIVPALQRLTGSKPTFVLLSGARLVNVIFGCNAPEVLRIITQEIEREKRAAEGLEKRTTVSLTRLSPAEVEYEERTMGSEGARLREERNRAQLEADRILRRILDEIAGNLVGTTVVVVFPDALQSDVCGEILASLRDLWDEMGFVVKREEQMELNREAVDLMFWERRLPQHDVLLDTVTQGESLVLMLECAPESPAEDEAVDDEEEHDVTAANVEHIIAKSIYGFLPGTGSSMELITPVESVTPVAERVSLLEQLEEEDEGVAETLEKGVEGDQAGEDELEDEDEGLGDEDAEVREEEEEEEEEEEGGEEGPEDDQEDTVAEDEVIGMVEDEEEDATDGAVSLPEAQDDEDGLVVPQEPIRVWNPRELLPALDSAAARLLFRADEKGPVLPGVWTPLTAVSKAAAVKALFEDVAEPLYHPPTPPPPPPPESTVICFAGDKREEVLGLSENFPSEVTRFAFFTKSRKLLASTRADYEKLVRGGLQTAKTVVVLEVTRVRSAPLLELATAGPLYISATPAIAKADVDEFFGARVARAGQEDLREIVKVQEEQEDAEVTPPVKAVSRTPTVGEDAEGHEQDGLDAGAQVAHVDGAAATPGEAQEGQHGLGDGEAVPEQEAQAVAEGAADATAADVAAEEQLLNEAGEGDAPEPEGPRRSSAVRGGDNVPAAEG